MSVPPVEIVNGISAGDGRGLFLIAGPCVIESMEMLRQIAERTLEITTKLRIPYIFKSSFDKANRSSIKGFRGPGPSEGLSMLAELKKEFGIPLLTDIHSPGQTEYAANVVDVLQIPAFLCRQTDLLVAAAKSGKTVNVKKGQFLSPWDVGNIVEKLRESGGNKIMLTERGASFGYRNLVVDMKSIPVMRETGVPVIFDATHSVQQPGGLGDASGGQREFIPTLALAAVAAGADGLFMEVHPDPDSAKSDGPNMWPLDELKPLLHRISAVAKAVRGKNE